MAFRNYTGRKLDIICKDGSTRQIEPEGRVVAKVHEWDNGLDVVGVPVKTVAFTGEITGMPDDLASDDRVIVPSIAMQAFPEGAPVVGPGRLVRDGDGNVVKANGLKHVSPSGLHDGEEHGFAAFGPHVEVVNLTPHAVNIVNADGDIIKTFEPSGQVARMSERHLGSEVVDGIEVSSVMYGDTVGLPDREEYTMYIVGGLVARANAGYRQDLVCPHDVVRDPETHRIVGAQSLALQMPTYDMELEHEHPGGPTPTTWDEIYELEERFRREDMEFFAVLDARMAELAAKEAPVFEGPERQGRENDGPDLDAMPF